MHQVVRALNPRAGSSGSLCPPGSFAAHPGPWPVVSYPDWSASVVWQLPWLSRSAFSAGVCGLKGLLLAAVWSTLSLEEQIPYPSLSVGLPCPDSRQVSRIRATESLQPRVPPPHVITGVAEAGENDLPKAKELLEASSLVLQCPHGVAAGCVPWTGEGAAPGGAAVEWPARRCWNEHAW